MKTNPILHAMLLATMVLATGAAAQTANPTPTSAPSLVGAMPAPNQVIYIPQLPNPDELAQAAAAQGISVQQINQTSNQITVVYKYANGQTNTICYQLLPTAGTAPAVAATTTSVVPATTTVVYATPAPAYYYDPFYYRTWPWFAPVSIGLGFNFGHGYYHGYGGYRGGFHGGFHGHGR